MTLKTSFTPAEEQLLEDTKNYWIAKGRSTERLDVAKATEGVRGIYKLGGIKMPETVLLFPSPYAAVKQIQQWRKEFDGIDRTFAETLNAESRFYGAHWCAWEVFFDFGAKVTKPYPKEDQEKLDAWLLQSEHCFWWWGFQNAVMLSDRPTQLHVDTQGRLHNETGPAMLFSDGFSLYSYHGILVDKQIIESPETITLSQIKKEDNSEIKRILTERYGYERYLRESKAKLIDQRPENDPQVGLRTAKLWRIDDQVLLDLLNSTPEPDGSVKRYVIPINPDLYNGDAGRNVAAASVSTWRKRTNPEALAFDDWRDYQPVFES
jgi:hypothetical protein